MSRTKIAKIIRGNSHKTASEIAGEFGYTIQHVNLVARMIQIDLPARPGWIQNAIYQATRLEARELILTANHFAGPAETAKLLNSLITSDDPVTPAVVYYYSGKQRKYRPTKEFLAKFRSALNKEECSWFLKKYMTEDL